MNKMPSKIIEEENFPIYYHCIIKTNRFQCLSVSAKRLPSESDRGLQCNQSVCLLLTTQIRRFSLTGPSCLGFILTTVWERSVWGSSTFKSSAQLPLSRNTDGSRCSWHSMEQHLTALIHSDTQKHSHTNINTGQHIDMCTRSGILIWLHKCMQTYCTHTHTISIFPSLMEAHTLTLYILTRTRSQQEHMLPRIYKSSQ